MPKRRSLFRLGEVENELAKHIDRNLHQVLLTDLQLGTLRTVVQFPTFRNGLTVVGIQIWNDVDLEDFVPRPGKRSSQVEFELAAEEFVDAERKKLRTTTVAIFRRSTIELDVDYIEFFRSGNQLKKDMGEADWEKLLLQSFRWQRELSEEANTALVPMVTSDELENYIAQLRADSSPAKGAPGRKPADSWLAIYTEAIRQLAGDSNLLKEGNVQGFAKALNQWATGTYGKNAGVPAEATIAERLREVRDGKWKA